MRRARMIRFLFAPLLPLSALLSSVAALGQETPMTETGASKEQAPAAPGESPPADVPTDASTGDTAADGAAVPEAGEPTPAPEPAAPPAAPSNPPPVVAAPPTVPPPAPPPQPTEPAEPRGPRRMLLLLGPGFGLGFMYPKEINDFMENWTSSLGAEVEEGTSAMVLCIQPRVVITFAPIEYVQIQLVGEIGWAPKVMTVVGGDNRTFHFLRYSTGGTVAGHLPIRGGRSSVSLGAGVLFNALEFEGIQEITPGYRGVFGFRFYGRRAFTPEIFVEFNWIRADTGRDPGGRNPGVIGELDYVSGTIGANFYFKLFERR
jgi:hypothetical protein